MYGHLRSTHSFLNDINLRRIYLFTNAFSVWSAWTNDWRRSGRDARIWTSHRLDYYITGVLLMLFGVSTALEQPPVFVTWKTPKLDQRSASGENQTTKSTHQNDPREINHISVTRRRHIWGVGLSRIGHAVFFTFSIRIRLPVICAIKRGNAVAGNPLVVTLIRHSLVDGAGWDNWIRFDQLVVVGIPGPLTNTQCVVKSSFKAIFA